MNCDTCASPRPAHLSARNFKFLGPASMAVSGLSACTQVPTISLHRGTIHCTYQQAPLCRNDFILNEVPPLTDPYIVCKAAPHCGEVSEIVQERHGLLSIRVVLLLSQVRNLKVVMRHLSGRQELLQSSSETQGIVDQPVVLQLFNEVSLSAACQATDATIHSTRQSWDEPYCSVPLGGSSFFGVTSVSLFFHSD